MPLKVTDETTLAKVSQALPSAEVFTDLSDLYKVLADYTRARILWALSVNEMCVGDIAILLGMTSTAVSHQLRVLKTARLVKSERRGRTIYYSFADEHVSDIFRCGIEHITE